MTTGTPGCSSITSDAYVNRRATTCTTGSGGSPAPATRSARTASTRRISRLSGEGDLAQPVGGHLRLRVDVAQPQPASRMGRIPGQRRPVRLRAWHGQRKHQRLCSVVLDVIGAVV